MIRSGDTIHNPVTGERITFHQTSADTNGEAVVIECTVQPDGFVAAAHVHPSQTERFNVIDGRLGARWKSNPSASTCSSRGATRGRSTVAATLRSDEI